MQIVALQNNTFSTESVKSSLKKLFTNNFEYTPIVYVECTDVEIVNDTLVCMNLSEKSLSKDWDNEADEHWNNY